jgi:hypothetical protein
MNAKPCDRRHYRGIEFQFESPAIGARQLFEALGPIPFCASPGKPGCDRLMTLDRINPSGPYSLENLRYADARTQTRNRVIASIEEKRRLASPLSGFSFLPSGEKPSSKGLTYGS